MSVVVVVVVVFFVFVFVLFVVVAASRLVDRLGVEVVADLHQPPATIIGLLVDKDDGPLCIVEDDEGDLVAGGFDGFTLVFLPFTLMTLVPAPVLVTSTPSPSPTWGGGQWMVSPAFKAAKSSRESKNGKNASCGVSPSTPTSPLLTPPWTM